MPFFTLTWETRKNDKEKILKIVIVIFGIRWQGGVV
jgi:hypothetical protein